MNANAAVTKPNVKNKSIFKTTPTPSYFINDVPSNKFVIQIGRTLSIKRAASPNVRTTISEDFLFSRISSE